MKRIPFVAAALASGPLSSQPALADVKYGPWIKTSDCRPLQKGGNLLPYAPGGSGRPTECKYQREVQECQTMGDKVRHWIRCFITRRETSGYTTIAPNN
jgi:hypothetical protein